MPPKRNRTKKTSAGSSGGEDVFISPSGDMQKIDRLELELKRFREDVVEMLAEKDAEIKLLKEEIVFLRKGVSAVEERCDEAEAYERRDTIIVSGPEMPIARDGENSAQVVCDVIKNKIGVVVRSSDISVAHRHGRKTQSQREDRRGIMVKLCRRETKHDLLRACKSVKPPNLFINDSLTPIRNSILYGLRQAKKKHPSRISGCGSIDGRIFAWVRPASRDSGNKDFRIFINTKLKFDMMCKDILNCESSDLVDKWPGC